MIGKWSIGEGAIGEDLANEILLPAAINVNVSIKTPTIFQQVYVPHAEVVGVSILAPSVVATVFQNTNYGSAIAEDCIGSGSIGEGAELPESYTAAIPNALPITVGSLQPKISAGAIIRSPVASITLSVGVPRVAISATQNVPKALVSVAAKTPKLELVLHWPKTNIIVAVKTPLPTAGKSQFVPNKQVAVAVLPPEVLTGFKISVPKANIAIAALAPRSETGLLIRAWNVTTVQYDVGSIGDYAIGEYAIAESAVESRVVQKSLEVTVQANAPFITAGKSQFVPAANITLGTLDARVVFSATVTIPEAKAIQVQAYAPKLELVLHWPSINIAVGIKTPLVTSGKAQFVDKVDINVGIKTPFVTAGKSQLVPTSNIIVELKEPRIETGLVIKAWNKTTITQSRGSIADSSIATLAITEHVTDSYSYESTLRIVVQTNEPQILTGKIQLVPTSNISVGTRAAQISARRRRIQIMSVAS